MSIISATMVCTALLGADPNVVTSEHTEAANQQSGQVVQVHCEKTSCAATNVACGASGCQTTCTTDSQTACNTGCQAGSNGGCNNGACNNGGCNNGGCKSGCRCKHGYKHWCPLCGFCGGDDDCDDDCDLNCCERRCLTYCVGPGDMYPHYPYFPAYHGYYYFRPYNWDHVVPDSELAAQMGGDPRAPYSVEFLRSVFPPAPVEEIPEHIKHELPILEDLLNSKKSYE